MNQEEIRLHVRAHMDVACITMRVREVAKEIGFKDLDQCRIATAASELAQNILKYAQCGCVTIVKVCCGGHPGLEIRAEDQGPGIDDINNAIKDHFSSGGTLGLGLPGVRRLMDDFVIHSEPGQGTRIKVRKWL